jgi:hypothetical protein
MLKRLLMVSALVALALSPAALLGALYYHDRPVPYESNTTPACGQHVAPTCPSLTMMFVAGTALRVAGVALCALAVAVGAVLLLRLTAFGRLALVLAIAVTASGAYALWLSQQALRDYTSLSLIPYRFPPGWFERYVAYVEQRAQSYMDWSSWFAFLTAIMLLVSLAVLWRSASQRHEQGPTPFSLSVSTVDRSLLLGVLAALLLTPAFVLGAAYELERPAPCQLQADSWCASRDAMIAAGAVSRGAGFALFGLALVLGCLLLTRPRPPLPLTLGAATLAGVSGAWLLWLSQRALEDDAHAPLDAAPFPLPLFDGPVVLVERLALTYIAWSIGALALAAIVALLTMRLLRNLASPPQRTIAFTPAL